MEKNVIVKREVIESLKEKVVSGLPFNEDRKRFIRENLSVEEFYNYFITPKEPGEFKTLSITSRSFLTPDDFVNYTKDFLKLIIKSAILEATIKLDSISKRINEEEIMNHLIDLKTLEEIEIVQRLIADTLENKSINNYN